jgi:hypothetical protein
MQRDKSFQGARTNAAFTPQVDSLDDATPGGGAHRLLLI